VADADADADVDVLLMLSASKDQFRGFPSISMALVRLVPPWLLLPSTLLSYSIVTLYSLLSITSLRFFLLFALLPSWSLNTPFSLPQSPEASLSASLYNFFVAKYCCLVQPELVAHSHCIHGDPC
jgi:hypothetical protein